MISCRKINLGEIMLTIRKPDDFHLHLRADNMLKMVLKYTENHFKRALIMPNVPAICTADDLCKYRNEILTARTNDSFYPLMTLKLDANTTPKHIEDTSKVGAIAAKLYPFGVTTGSSTGVQNFDSLNSVFETMIFCDMVLCVHGETPGIFCLDREVDFLDTLKKIRMNFPKLRIVLEHLTTSEAVEFVSETYNMAATITAHHLVDTLDSVIGDLLDSHRFCKPIPKRPKDRQALRNAACSGNPKFFFGSDSAPHFQDRKESSCGCAAGCFTAPTALATLAEIFEEANALTKLENFTSKFGAEFYGLSLNTETITLEKTPWTVETISISSYDGLEPNGINSELNRRNTVVPWRHGETLSWKVMER
jgi:dihydroorotase